MTKSGSIIHASDFYKVSHPPQYPVGTTEVYSNLTARGSRLAEVEKIVVFGLQYFVQEYLVTRFNTEFFQADKATVLAKYQRRMDTSLGPNAVTTERWSDLHDLGYLPLLIKALPEGSRCPMRVPFLTIKNTKKEFFWLTNWVESLMSNVIWHPITTATIAHSYRMLLDAQARKSTDILDFVQWQGHDFAYRGMDESVAICGAGHLLSFTGTDTIPAIDALEDYYGANAETELIGGSVPATEHSVMCMGGESSEFETFRRLIEDVYPTGIVSIVSDTWDYWKILTETLPSLKDRIMSRDGKVVIRPDSGDPVKIIVGDADARIGSPEARGTIQILWDTFGGTVNSKGYKQLDPHIGAIYGDSITYDRAKQITEGLMEKGFASTNIVFGIGSFTYQYVTRDTFGMAMKATSGVIRGERVTISKNPKTDNGLKKSAKGLLCVDAIKGAHGVIDFALREDVTVWQEANEGALEIIFENGKAGRTQTLAEIRERLARS
jgi:nicotinamide phosphoribosyltransferase